MRHRDPMISRRVCIKLRNLVYRFPEEQIKTQQMCRVKWCGVEVGLFSLNTGDNKSLLTDPTFYLPTSPVDIHKDWTLDIHVEAMGIEGLPEGIGFIKLKGKHLLRAPVNRNHYEIISGDDIRYDKNLYCPASIGLLSQSNFCPVRSPAIEVLTPMVLNLLICWEESFVNIPYYLALQVRAAKDLASPSPLGHNRIIGRKRRRVCGLLQHNGHLWSSTISVLSSSLGNVVFHGPGGLIPIPNSPTQKLHIFVSVWDYGLSTRKEEIQSLKIQCAVRCWIARRRVSEELVERKTAPECIALEGSTAATA